MSVKWKDATSYSRLAKESTAAKAGGRNNQPASHGSSVVERRGASCDGPRPLVGGSIPSLPVDTNPAPGRNPLDVVTSLAGVDGDKDRPKFNKNEYQCRYMREVYRPRLKAKKEAAK